MLESDWSGRGQHAAFLKRETKMLNTILDVQDILGTTSTAIVQSVKCKRILLARKTIRCSERFTKRKAIDEVAHLSKLNHSHVVQVIGTYIAGNELSILMYPVAESNLESFMQTLDPGTQLRHEWEGSVIALSSFFGCLSHAVDYIHLNLTKHMDIKPQNLLVRNIQRSKIDCSLDYKIYIADFGIARSYEKLEFTDTEGPTMFTRKYAAPEVVDRQKRGLSADIFSLGCVFVEICATISNFFPYTPAPAPASMFGQLASYRSTAHQHAKISSNGEYDPLRCLKALLASNEYENTSYSANIYSTCNFVEEMHYAEDLSPLYTSEMAIKVLTRLPLETVANMLRENPLERPSARLVASSFTVGMCCEAGTDMLEAAPEEDFRRYAASVAEDESE
jgi:serine/threonine protein kinase